jgi:ATP-dependent Clp protease adapter protein ClpS
MRRKLSLHPSISVMERFGTPYKSQNRDQTMDRRSFAKSVIGGIGICIGISIGLSFPLLASERTEGRASEEYEIVIHNDYRNILRFVEDMLKEIFSINQGDALHLSIKNSHRAWVTCNTYSKDEAMRLSIVAMSSARKYGFPLECSYRLKSVDHG